MVTASRVRRTRCWPTATISWTTLSTPRTAMNSWLYCTRTSTTTSSTTLRRSTKPTSVTRPWKSLARSTTWHIDLRLH